MAMEDGEGKRREKDGSGREERGEGGRKRDGPPPGAPWAPNWEGPSGAAGGGVRLAGTGQWALRPPWPALRPSLEAARGGKKKGGSHHTNTAGGPCTKAALTAANVKLSPPGPTPAARRLLLLRSLRHLVSRPPALRGRGAWVVLEARITLAVIAAALRGRRLWWIRIPRRPTRDVRPPSEPWTAGPSRAPPRSAACPEPASVSISARRVDCSNRREDPLTSFQAGRPMPPPLGRLC